MQLQQLELASGLRSERWPQCSLLRTGQVPRTQPGLAHQHEELTFSRETRVNHGGSAKRCGMRQLEVECGTTEPLRV